MAKLTQMPEQAIIDGFKGKLDFYAWKGIPCVRMWPRYFTRKPHPAEAANQQRFAYINQLASTLPAYIIDQYKAMAVGTPFSWKDLLVQSYIKGMNVSPP